MLPALRLRNVAKNQTRRRSGALGTGWWARSARRRVHRTNQAAQACPARSRDFSSNRLRAMGDNLPSRLNTEVRPKNENDDSSFFPSAVRAMGQECLSLPPADRSIPKSFDDRAFRRNPRYGAERRAIGDSGHISLANRADSSVQNGRLKPKKGTASQRRRKAGFRKKSLATVAAPPWPARRDRMPRMVAAATLAVAFEKKLDFPSGTTCRLMPTLLEIAFSSKCFCCLVLEIDGGSYRLFTADIWGGGSNCTEEWMAATCRPRLG